MIGRSCVTVLAFVLLWTAGGCRHCWRATIYNGSGEDLTLRLQGREMPLADGARWQGEDACMRRYDDGRWGPAEREFSITDSRGVVRNYAKAFGPAGCAEFPTRGLCNTLRIVPGGSIWYVGGRAPTAERAGDLPPLPAAQPEGFPMSAK